MSEQENRLAECKRLVLAFIAMSPDTENASPCVAKGGVLSKSGAAKDSDHEREKRENGDGAANSELLKLINEYQPPASSSGNSLVPDTLPRELKDRLLQLQREDFVEAFKVEAALEKVEKGVVSRRELICMYLKSFRNIFTYDLDELRDHTQVCERIVGYFSYVLQDVIESLYPTPREPWSVVSATVRTRSRVWYILYKCVWHVAVYRFCSPYMHVYVLSGRCLYGFRTRIA